MSEVKTIQQCVVETAVALNASGVNDGRSGNVSARHRNGLLITASGRHFDHIGADKVVAVDASGNWRGAMRPSAEVSFHLAVYEARPDIEAVVHMHSLWATTLACMHKSIPALHFMMAVAVGASLDAAFELAQKVEHLTWCYAQALSTGEPVLLTDQQMDEALEQFRDYRKAQV